ncbi:MAG: DNA topoisomerase (ATP-hydrolyzing) subunit B [Candidatus Yanofskybacteria bacterium]|nr:DNA topoisomerase (ATP-hydrolyzing) subunit B [Candidatus Yanofskybacteria bacterium]
MAAKENTKQQGYTAESIQVLEGLEPVRKRPGMYIGSTGPDGLHHLIHEVADNGIDEAMIGYAKNIEISLLPNNRVRVKDDGRGIPVERHKQTGKSTLETVMTILHAGGKFGSGAYKVSGGLHGVGVSVVNALSVYLRVEVRRDGGVYEQEYVRGKPKKAVKKIGFAKDTGTMVEFEPDPEIFKEISFDLDRIINHFRQQAYLTKGVRISVKDERVPLKYFSKKQNKEITEFPSRSFYFEGGIVSYIEFLNRGLEPKNKNIFYVGKEQQEIFVEVALQYIDELHSQEMSFANNIHTHEGGMHVTGFRSAITRALNDYARKNGILKEKDDNLSGEDIREGLTTVISVKLKEPQFEGQTKAKLGTPDARTAVETVMGTEFVDWLERSPSDAREILEKVILASKARLAAKAARETVLRKGAMEGLTLPGKLADCSSRDATESELFLVEGDSAGGCLDGDTEVALVDGRDVSFRQLVEEDNQGKKNFCYTIDKNGNISVASILNPRITRKNVEVIKIILDNNEEIICTPDHKFMLRDGSYKEAKDLTPADSLMPLYRKYSKIGGRITIEGYEMVLDPKKHFWIFTHLLSDQYNLNHSIYSESDGPQRHHKDFNKLNNSPNNFVRLSREQHFKIHQEIADKILRSPEVLEKLRKIRQTPEFKNKVRKSMLKIRGLLSERAKKQWQDEEYKKFMVNKFLDFYKNNPEYQEKNNLLLDKAQKEYWGNKNNRKIQSNRVAKFFESHPEKKEWLSNIAKTQWQNPELLSWRSGKTKEQWTPGFRAKRKAAYNKTYLSRALKVLHDIYKESGIVDIEKYQAVRQNTNDKNLIKPETILARFFDNNNPQFVEAVKNFNHRIKRIEKLDYLIDVYDIEIPETHNFALASGVFVHNSSKQGRDRKTQAILPLKGKILNVEKARIDKMLAHQEIRALIIAMGTAIAEEFDLNKLRYHKIIIMTDADVDGSHIRTLLLTLFYRYFPQVIEKGHLYIAQPPLYKIQKSGKISYAYNDNEKEKILAELGKAQSAKRKAQKNDDELGKAQSAKRKAQKNDEWEVTPLEGNGNPLANGGESTTDEKISGVSIQRYKGLGEMNPIQLWETTLDPANRVLLQVTIKDAHEADRVFDVLMGSDVLPRKKFIQSHAKSVQNLDI